MSEILTYSFKAEDKTINSNRLFHLMTLSLCICTCCHSAEAFPVSNLNINANCVALIIAFLAHHSPPAGGGSIKGHSDLALPLQLSESSVIISIQKSHNVKSKMLN